MAVNRLDTRRGERHAYSLRLNSQGRGRSQARRPSPPTRKRDSSPARPSSISEGEDKMNSRLLMTVQVEVGPPERVGSVPHGTRAIAAITGGHFEGPKLHGKVLPGGADWTLLRSDGVLELDLRITLQTHDDALIYLASFGMRHGPPEVIAALGRGETVDPARYYFRTTP